MPEIENVRSAGVEGIQRTLRSVTRSSSPAGKIELFRSLFRARTDVYAQRFESRSGKTGYAPACAHEWVAELCQKPRIRCAECPNRRFLPLTDAVIQAHLSGSRNDHRDFVIGIYPMLLDETCFFLALDLDGVAWQNDALAIRETCRRLNLPAAIERSRSGNGAHLWLFFEEAVPAALARRVGAYIVTETMERRPEIGFASYDRMFPAQDTLPKGGFGNLIALPLQHAARLRGNSVFLDDELQPHGDQWAYLASLEKVGRRTLESMATSAEAGGRIIGPTMSIPDEQDRLPWLPPSTRRRFPPIAGPLPSSLEIVLADRIYVEKSDLSPSLRNRIIRLAAFPNPEFHRAQAMRLPTWGKPRVIHCAEEHAAHIALPRGCLEELEALARVLGIELTVRDERSAGIPLDVNFVGNLRAAQKAAAEAILASNTGVLAAPPGFGKTVIGAWLIAQRRVSTLVLVHRQSIQEQWIEHLSALLGIPLKEIGRLGGGRRKLTGRIDVALIQSLGRKGEVDERVRDYGHVVVDECHHIPALTFERVASSVTAKYVTGLTATVARKDGHHPIVFMQCGPLRHRADSRARPHTLPLEQRVVVRPTGFKDEDPRDHGSAPVFNRLCEALSRDDSRNRMICDDVIAAIREGRTPLVLTERTEHLDELARRLESEQAEVITLRGGMPKQMLRQSLDLLKNPASSPRVIVATGSFIGEGFDDPRLDTLFLTMPVSWRGTIAQYVGRLHRLHEGKREARVYDYADLEVPMLSRMFERRCRGYGAIGYRLELPASAAAGWPADVSLPVDPAWKRDYAATITRMARDGVDRPLASLFAESVCVPDANAEGAERARSSMERFLYERLETLPETAGRFRLNTQLAIPFDGWGRMEVDLLCSEVRLVIEIDGSQHLGDPEAYRRDRRKDAMLQQNGYLVLRFLAEDVGKRLDEVLDRILAGLQSRPVRCG